MRLLQSKHLSNGGMNIDLTVRVTHKRTYESQQQIIPVHSAIYSNVCDISTMGIKALQKIGNFFSTHDIQTLYIGRSLFIYVAMKKNIFTDVR